MGRRKSIKVGDNIESLYGENFKVVEINGNDCVIKFDNDVIKNYSYPMIKRKDVQSKQSVLKTGDIRVNKRGEKYKIVDKDLNGITVKFDNGVIKKYKHNTVYANRVSSKDSKK